MYSMSCTISGLYQDINDDSGNLWGLYSSPALYLGNGLYYIVVDWSLYPSGDPCPLGYIVKFVSIIDIIF